MKANQYFTKSDTFVSGSRMGRKSVSYQAKTKSKGRERKGLGRRGREGGSRENPHHLCTQCRKGLQAGRMEALSIPLHYGYCLTTHTAMLHPYQHMLSTPGPSSHCRHNHQHHVIHQHLLRLLRLDRKQHTS